MFNVTKILFDVLGYFLNIFYVLNIKANFQNYFAKKLINWFVFEAVQYTISTCFIGKHIFHIPISHPFLEKPGEEHWQF